MPKSAHPLCHWTTTRARWARARASTTERAALQIYHAAGVPGRDETRPIPHGDVKLREIVRMRRLEDETGLGELPFAVSAGPSTPSPALMLDNRDVGSRAQRFADSRAAELRDKLTLRSWRRRSLAVALVHILNHALARSAAGQVEYRCRGSPRASERSAQRFSSMRTGSTAVDARAIATALFAPEPRLAPGFTCSRQKFTMSNVKLAASLTFR